MPGTTRIAHDLTEAPTAPYDTAPRASGDNSVGWQEGTGTGQFNRLHESDRSVAALGAETLDLTTLTRANGAALGLTQLRGIRIQASASNPGDLVFKTGAANGFTDFLNGGTDGLVVKPGDDIIIQNSLAGARTVTGAKKTIDVSNGHATLPCLYTLTVFGVYTP